MTILLPTARQEHYLHFSSTRLRSSLSDCCDREGMTRETAVLFSALLRTSWVILGEGSVLVGLSLLVFTVRIIILSPSAGLGA